MDPAIIILHGTSSSGKTSLAESFQASYRTPIALFSLDRFMSFMPKNMVRDELVSIYSKVVSTQIDSTIAAFNNGLIPVLDTVIEEEFELNLYQRAFHPYPAFFVNVHCDLHALNERELSRGNRRVGMAEKQLELFESIPFIFDHKIDTTAKSPEECSVELYNHITNSEPSAFHQLKGLMGG